MRFLFFLIYYVEGFIMAIVACAAIGLALCAVLAMFKSFTRPKNLLFVFGYVVGSFICYELFLGGFFLAGWIGDRSHYAGQTGMLVGAVFPGVFSLALIPQFLVVASKQTSGIHVE